MKIIRWLFSNFFLIFLIVVVIYSYMFWGNLTGSDTPAGKAIAYLSSEFVEVEEFINAVKSKQQSRHDTRQDEDQQSIAASQKSAAVSGSDAQSDGQMENTSANADTADVPQNDNASQAGSDDANSAQSKAAVANVQQQPAVTISYGQNENRVKQNSVAKVEQPAAASSGSAAVSDSIVPVAEVQTAEDQVAEVQVAEVQVAEVQTVEDQAVANGGEDTFVPAEVERQLENVDDNGKVIDASQQAGNVRDNWVTARKSFYQRDYELSEKSYLKVIDSTEDNFDAYGELGNVYFNQGKNKQAAEAYFEAASILVRQGQINRARSLTGLLRHLDRSKAQELQKTIEAARSGN